MGDRAAVHSFCVPVGPCLATLLPRFSPLMAFRDHSNLHHSLMLHSPIGFFSNALSQAALHQPFTSTTAPHGATVSIPLSGRVHSLTCSDNYNVTYRVTHVTLLQTRDLSTFPPRECLYHPTHSIHPAPGPRLITQLHTDSLAHPRFPPVGMATPPPLACPLLRALAHSHFQVHRAECTLSL